MYILSQYMYNTDTVKMSIPQPSGHLPCHHPDINVLLSSKAR